MISKMYDEYDTNKDGFTLKEYKNMIAKETKKI